MAAVKQTEWLLSVLSGETVHSLGDCAAPGETCSLLRQLLVQILSLH